MNISKEKKEKMDRDQKSTFLSVTATDVRIENLKNIRWWIAQHVRSSVRRLRLVELRFSDLCSRLKWAGLEGFVIQQVLDQIGVRKSNLSDSSTKLAQGWLNTFDDITRVHYASLDSLQESLLQDEMDRLSKDEATTVELDSLLEELRTAIFADSQYAAERVHLERLQLRALKGSDDAVDLGIKLVQLKKKQVQLQENVIDNIKVGLEDKYNTEEEILVSVASFPTDAVDLPTEEMEKITATLIESHNPGKNFDTSEFLSIFLGQPWLVQEALNDVKLEEDLKSKELELDQLNIEIEAFRKRSEEASENMATLSTQISDLQGEIERHSQFTGTGDEPDDEKQDRLFILNTLELELKKRESELSVSRKLEENRIQAGQPNIKKLDDLSSSILIEKDTIEAKRYVLYDSHLSEYFGCTYFVLSIVVTYLYQEESTSSCK